MDLNRFQRQGSISNSHVGRDFETVAQLYFKTLGIGLTPDFPVPVGVDGKEKKKRKFDLGSQSPPILVECKSHKWTDGDNIPSAKITVWNESMYYFHLAPPDFRKILFVLRDYSAKRGESLAEYYARHNGHLVPDGVEILEYDEEDGAVRDVLGKA
jgi:hypothetical protein